MTVSTPCPLARFLWRALAAVMMGLAVLGVVLPVLPTVPFLLVALWAAGKGWPALERWLLNHPVHGPALRQWREHGAVSRRGKWAATLAMTVSATALAFTTAPLAVKIAVPVVMAMVAGWLWCRPTPVS